MSPLSLSILTLVGIGVILLARPRRFYFVRHGETLMNAKHIRQGEEGGLSELGKQQAESVGRYLRNFPIKRMISSTYPRARETTTIINGYLRVLVIYSTLLVERKNPSEIIGKDRDDPSTMHITDQMDLAYHTDDYHFSDEENFIELKKRARKCLNFLAYRGARETVVVTHHVFLKMLVAYLLYRKRLHAADFTKLSFFNYSDNAGITVCEFHPWKILSPTFGWEVVSYNEQPE